MPVRTRADMHIGLDLALEVLNATPTNRMDPAVKDYFLNRTISEFVKDVINKANTPDETKRVPFRLLTHGDILNKYNDIYTLIKVDDTVTPLTIIDNNFYQYTLPTDLLRFEASYSVVLPTNCNIYPISNVISAALGSGAGNVDNGQHYYFITYMYGTVETNITSASVANATVVDKAVNGKISLTSIPDRPSTCTSIKIYRSKVGEAWYKGRLLTTLSADENTYTDNTADVDLGVLYTGNTNETTLPNLLLSNYDITAFNDNPYGGKGKYIGTILESNLTLLSGNLRVYHLNRYTISKLGIIYVKKPAILTSSPSAVNCDLPISVHDRIVDDTAKFIAATTANNNYQQLLMEAKSQNQ